MHQGQLIDSLPDQSMLREHNLAVGENLQSRKACKPLTEYEQRGMRGDFGRLSDRWLTDPAYRAECEAFHEAAPLYPYVSEEFARALAEDAADDLAQADTDTRVTEQMKEMLGKPKQPFKVGDLVRVHRKVEHDDGPYIRWVDDMDIFIGRTGLVVYVDSVGVFVRIDDTDFVYPPSSLLHLLHA